MLKEDVLVDVGLTSTESKIYLSLLELGFTTVTSISERTKLHRTNVYDSLKKLCDKGLVSFMKQDNITFYEAASPHNLLGFLKEKEDNIRRILPQLLLSKKLAENSSDFCVVKGVSSFIEALHGLLDHDSEILVFGMPERAIKLLGARIFPFHKLRLEKNISLRQIYFFDLKKYVKKSGSDLTSTRFCKISKDSGVSSIICEDEILITDWSGDVFTLRIKSSGVAKHYVSQFRILWDNSRR